MHLTEKSAADDQTSHTTYEQGEGEKVEIAPLYA